MVSIFKVNKEFRIEEEPFLVADKTPSYLIYSDFVIKLGKELNSNGIENLRFFTIGDSQLQLCKFNNSEPGDMPPFIIFKNFWLEKFGNSSGHSYPPLPAEMNNNDVNRMLDFLRKIREEHSRR